MLWRVWKLDGRYRLVTADTETDACAQVKNSVRATPVRVRRQPVGGRG